MAPALTYAAPHDPPWKRWLIRGIEWMTGGRTIRRLYAPLAACAPDRFWKAALDRLRVDVRCSGAPLGCLPAHERVVVVANHPYGVLDGLVLCHLVARRRSDFKLLIHHALCRSGHFDDHFLPVDFRDGDAARRTNLRTMRAALAHLKAGGCVVIFPAGGIATATPFFSDAEDLPWQPFAAKLVQSMRATVVPVHFSGQNSRLFHLASGASETLRLALILHELRACMGRTLPVRVGAPIPYAALAHREDTAALTQHLRARTLALAA